MEYASNQGVTIDYVDFLAFDGQIPENRAPHQGVFQQCFGDIEDGIVYGGIPITTRYIEDFILNEYQFRDILYTPQQFIVEVGNVWNRYFIPFYQNLKNAQDFSVEDESEKVTETFESTAKQSATGSGETKYSDTPNQFLTNPDTFNGLTSYSAENNKGEQSGEGSGSRTIDRKRAHNMFERWLEISRKNRNIIYEFIDAFGELFQTTYIINRR